MLKQRKIRAPIELRNLDDAMLKIFVKNLVVVSPKRGDRFIRSIDINDIVNNY